MKYKFVFFAVIIFCCISSFSQYKKVNNTTQLWSEVDLLGNITKKLRWQCDFQYSRQSAYESLKFLKYDEQLTIRPWLHYFPNKNIKPKTQGGTKC